MVADEAEVERDAGLRRIAERCGHAGVGDGHDEVGGDAGLAGELPAHLFARLLHPAAEDARVGPREVDVLEDAACRAASSRARSGGWSRRLRRP